MIRSRIALWNLVAMLLTLSSTAYGAQKRTCALLTLDTGPSVHAGQAGLLANRMAAILTKRGPYTVLPRYQVNQALAAQGYEQATYSSRVLAAAVAGNILAVDFVILGRAGKEKDTYSLHILLVDVSTEKIVRAATFKSKNSWLQFLSEAPEPSLSKLVGLKKATTRKRPPSRLVSIPIQEATSTAKSAPPAKRRPTLSPPPSPERPKAKTTSVPRKNATAPKPLLAIARPTPPIMPAKLTRTNPLQSSKSPPIYLLDYWDDFWESFWQHVTLDRFAVGFESYSHTWQVYEYDNDWQDLVNDPSGTDRDWAHRDADISAGMFTIRYAVTPDIGLKFKIGQLKGGDNDVNLDPGPGEYNYESASALGVDVRFFSFASPLAFDLYGRYDLTRGKTSIWSRGPLLFVGSVEEWHADILASTSIALRGKEVVRLYGGPRYAEAVMTYIHENDGPPREGGFESEKEWGFVYGVEVLLLSRVRLSAEGESGAAKGSRISAAFQF